MMNRKKTFSRTFRKMKPLNRNTFTGAQVVPDLMSETGYALLPEASVSSPVNDGVLGKFGMLPPSGLVRPTNPSTNEKDGLTGSAGSFMTATAFASSQYS